MLKELLWEISQADYVSKQALASKLEQPIALIEAGFMQLVQLGYLEEDAGLADCQIPCGKCPYAKMCNQNFITTFSITEKGQKLLARL